MGQGDGLKPNDNKVVAPFYGEVVMIADSKHAIGLKSVTGIEFLIHISPETVELDMINESGRETITPFIVTNTNEFESVAVGETDDGQLKIDLIK